jgi:WD40 repeat protein
MGAVLRKWRFILQATLFLGLPILAAIAGVMVSSGVRSREPRLVFQNSQVFHPWSFSQDGQLLMAFGGGDPERFGLWDTRTGEEVSIYTDPTIRWGMFMPDGLLLVADDNRTLQVLDPITGHQRGTPLPNHLCPSQIVFSATGNIAVVNTWLHVPTVSAKGLEVWDTVTWKECVALAQPETSPIVVGVSHSPNGLMLGAAYGDDTVIWWDLSTGKQKARFEKPPGDGFTPQAFSSDLQTVAASESPPWTTGKSEQTLMLWRLVSGERTVLAPPLIPGDRFRIVLDHPFSPDGQTFAATRWRPDPPPSLRRRVAQLLHLPIQEGITSQVNLYDVPSGQLRAVLDDCYNGVFSPDGTTFAGKKDGPMKLWDVPVR